ncbi:MAG: hypothetical protein ABIJ61_14215 [bacterium]
MALASKEWRHLLLLTAIVAALPLLVFPNSLGLNLRLSFAIYIVVELAYFYVVFRLLNPGSDNRSATLGTLLSLAGRLLLSAAFWIYLVLFATVKPGIAFGQAFFSFKPALILFTLTAPVIFNSAIALVGYGMSRARARAPRRSTLHVKSPSSPAPSELRPLESAPLSRPKAESEGFGFGFEAAVRHVGEYSGVLCALLIDQEGLPVASFDRNDEDTELWSALVIEIAAELQVTLARIGSDDLSWLEFAYDGKRCYLLPVHDMWLLSIANAATDELEKIRMQQAAAMVSRYHQDRYQSQSHSLTEHNYAGSTVGA